MTTLAQNLPQTRPWSISFFPYPFQRPHTSGSNEANFFLPAQSQRRPAPPCFALALGNLGQCLSPLPSFISRAQPSFFACASTTPHHPKPIIVALSIDDVRFMNSQNGRVLLSCPDQLQPQLRPRLQPQIQLSCPSTCCAIAISRRQPTDTCALAPPLCCGR
ncbi:hypothetical protein VTK26DRAFT_9062 [Humicola hyalothermophila]